VRPASKAGRSRKLAPPPERSSADADAAAPSAVPRPKRAGPGAGAPAAHKGPPPVPDGPRYRLPIPSVVCAAGRGSLVPRSAGVVVPAGCSSWARGPATFYGHFAWHICAGAPAPARPRFGPPRPPDRPSALPPGFSARPLVRRLRGSAGARSGPGRVAPPSGACGLPRGGAVALAPLRACPLRRRCPAGTPLGRPLTRLRGRPAPAPGATAGDARLF